MSTRKGADWKRKVEGVAWPDVWVWAEDIRREFGLYTRVDLYPPAGSGRDPFGRVGVTLSAMLPGVGAQVRHTKWVDIPNPSRTRVEAVVLGLLVGLSKELDAGSWAAERAAGQLEMPF